MSVCVFMVPWRSIQSVLLPHYDPDRDKQLLKVSELKGSLVAKSLTPGLKHPIRSPSHLPIYHIWINIVTQYHYYQY